MTSTIAVPAELKAHRFLQLDSLRGLAALSVVLEHFLLIWPSAFRTVDESPLRFLVAGHEAVVFFFVLSGFVLSVPFSGQRPPRYGVYLLKRFCRLYLPYAAAVLISFVGDALLFTTHRTGNGWIDETWTSRPTSLLLLRVLVTSIPASQQLNTALWTLALEIRVSLFFPLLYWMTRRLGTVVTVVLLLILCVGCRWVHFAGVETVLLLSTASLFALGIGLQQHLGAVVKRAARLSQSHLMGLLIVAVLCLELPGAVLAHRVLPLSASAQAVKDLLVGLGACGVLIFALTNEVWRSVLLRPALVRLGALSYSTYLLHGTLVFALIRLFYGRTFLPFLFPVYLVVVYGVSEVFHRFVDQPAVFLGRAVEKKVRSREPIAA